MSKTPATQRTHRDARRHLMATLRTVYGVSFRRIARAAGIGVPLVEYHVAAHFPEHCAVCLATGKEAV